MHAWAPVTIASAALLVLTGPPKLRHPGSTVTALRSIGLHHAGARSVQLLGILEIVTGLAAVTIGNRATGIAVAVLYLGFTGFLVQALRSPTASCGCTARDDTPPTFGHLILTATFATVAVSATIAGRPTGLWSAGFGHHPVEAAVAVAVAGVLVWLAWAVLTLSARLTALRRT